MFQTLQGKLQEKLFSFFCLIDFLQLGARLKLTNFFIRWKFGSSLKLTPLHICTERTRPSLGTYWNKWPPVMALCRVFKCLFVANSLPLHSSGNWLLSVPGLSPQMPPNPASLKLNWTNTHAVWTCSQRKAFGSPIKRSIHPLAELGSKPQPLAFSCGGNGTLGAMLLLATSSSTSQ